MKRFLFFAVLVVALLPQTSRAQFYWSQSPHLPLMDGKGTLVVDANIPYTLLSAFFMSISMAEHGYFDFKHNCGWDGSVAYAFSDQWAALLSSRSDGEWGVEAMVGRFAPVKDRENAVWEVYGGYAFSSNHEHFERYNYAFDYGDEGADRDGFCHSLFVQANIGLPSFHPSRNRKDTWFTAGVGLRMGLVLCDYTKSWYYYAHYSGSGWTLFDQADYLALLGEIRPMFKVGIGGEQWKCDLGVSYTLVTSMGCPWNVNLALSYRVPLLKK